MSISRIIVALDFATAKEALALASQLDAKLCALKVGKELFVAGGPSIVETLVAQGFRVFLDLKFHDIPTTVAAACRAAANLGVWMLNVHATGGRAMMLAARAAIDTFAQPPLLVAVTILTSMSQSDLHDIGFAGSVVDNVKRLTLTAQECGLDGVVCSAQEAPLLRQQVAREFKLVTPGIRLATSAADDQQRVVTPRDAVQMGADYLVIGRPITRAPDPIKVLSEIQTSLFQEIRQ